MSEIPPEKWGFTQRHQRIFESKECLAGLHGSDPCAGKIVRAHIIPRSQLLKIATNGHVHAVPTRLSAVMQMQHSAFEATDMGAREFSVLNCFCAGHDNSLFAPLEDVPLTFSRKQLALLHYRAIAAEAYQRGNQEESAINECKKYDSKDPRRDPFYTIFFFSSDAAESAEDALKQTARMLAQGKYQAMRALVIRFDAEPVFLSVGAFRPHYDVTGKPLQHLIPGGVYVAAHMLVADNKPALIFTWLKGQAPAERFALSFASQPAEYYTTLAIQMAFEHTDFTCMKREWWQSLDGRKRRSLLNRVRNGNSLKYTRPKKYLSVRSVLDDWRVSEVEFVK
jgi:hypothetical protein